MHCNRSELDKAVAALKSGRLVAFPTETVYGLGADASNPEAIKLLYKVKGRPENHPVIVHLGKVEQLHQWALKVPPAAEQLARIFWPGPLTLILPKAEHVLESITGGQSSVGLRIPDHPIALELLRTFGGGVAAPSANRYGKVSPTQAQDVQRELGDEVSVILDGGQCQVGIESTIVDFTFARPRILRPGMILPAQIEAVTGSLANSTTCGATDAPRVPGGLANHYAPITPVRLIEPGQLANELNKLTRAGKTACVLKYSHITLEDNVPCISLSPEPHFFARQLYKSLRDLDDLHCDLILVEAPPEESAWAGIADRLQRASEKKEVRNG